MKSKKNINKRNLEHKKNAITTKKSFSNQKSNENIIINDSLKKVGINRLEKNKEKLIKDRNYNISMNINNTNKKDIKRPSNITSINNDLTQNSNKKMKINNNHENSNKIVEKKIINPNIISNIKNNDSNQDLNKINAKKYDFNDKRHIKNNLGIISIIIIIIVLLTISLYISYIKLGLKLTFILFGGITLILLIGKFIRHKKRNENKSKGKVLKNLLLIILTLLIIVLLGGTGFIIYIVKTAPSFDKELLKVKESTIIYDSNGEEIEKLGTEIRENIEYNELSEVLIDAIIATEDSRFFQHNGFDLMRFTKAALGQLAGKSDAGGGSTLSMQVVKNTFTNAEAVEGLSGIIRKFTDIYISIFQLEKNYTKEEIVEFYVNNHFLGGVYGVQEASQYYFGKNASELNLAEASLIAGLFKSPMYYNPYNYPKNAESRRDTVLYLMERHGYITSEERAMAKAIPIKSLLSYNTNKGSEYQGYIDTAVAEIDKRYGVNPYITPMLIYTNMVRSKQDAVNEIMTNDSYRWWKDKLTQGSVVVLNSNSGKIEAIGTGRNRNTKNAFNYATSINRQIGSTAKPLFDYGPGMEYNNWSTYTLFDDQRGYTYSNGTPIKNYDGKWEGPITLRRALSNSRNIPALKAFQQVDNKKIVDFVTKVGITPEISNGYIHEAHCIGAFTGSNPLTMAGAYQMFSNGGYYYEPYSVSKVIFRANGEKDEHVSPKQKVLSDSTSYMITDVLKGAVNYYQNYGLTKDFIASKSGTTNIDEATQKKLNLYDFTRDYWVVGYTNDIVISLWLGYDELDNVYKFKYSTDNNLRFHFFNAVAKKCLNHTGKDFTMPKSVVRVGVEKLSDPPALPSSNTPSDQIVYELFKKGTEPTEVSNKYIKLSAPNNFYVSVNDNSASLSWSAVKNPGYVKKDEFGYYVYFNNILQGFTTNTSYYITDLENFYGTYSVKTGYKNSTSSMSNASSFIVTVSKNYRVSVINNQTTYKVNDIIPETMYNGGLVKLYENNNDITNSAKISVVITNSQGIRCSTVSTDKADIYTISYTVTYETYTGSGSSQITIKN